MKTVLVTGAGGQLGKCIEEAVGEETGIDWLFMNSSEIDITSGCDLTQVFNNKRIDFCINCAAYTNVEKAESDREKAFLINAEAVKQLAEICKRNGTILYHFSTDYVFDGESNRPYAEEDPTNPVNVYGGSKLKGEKYIQDILPAHFIFRTSWLYSRYGHNFYKTILNKAAQGERLNITTSQTGSPTNAHQLAALVVRLIKENNSLYGLYHFSNAGETTWYGFAREILKASGNLDNVVLNEDNSYQTVATRPAYSVLNKSRVREILRYPVASWQEALRELHHNEIDIS